MTEALSWTDYVKMIAKTEGILYHQALAAASKTWPEYKAKHGTVPKPEPVNNPLAPDDNDSMKKVPAKRPKAPRKPRVTKAQKQAEEMEKLKMKAELLETKEKLREKDEKKGKKKPLPKKKKTKKVETESESESQSE